MAYRFVPTIPDQRDLDKRLINAKSAGTTESLLAKKANPNAQDTRYQRLYPLMLASVEKTRPLLAARADTNARDRDNNTALMYSRSAEKTQLLLGAGANPNAANDRGQTPLFIAYKHGDTSRMHALLHAKADPATRYNGNTMLMDAVLYIPGVTRDLLMVVLHATDPIAYEKKVMPDFKW